MNTKITPYKNSSITSNNQYNKNDQPFNSGDLDNLSKLKQRLLKEYFTGVNYRKKVDIDLPFVTQGIDEARQQIEKEMEEEKTKK